MEALRLAAGRVANSKDPLAANYSSLIHFAFKISDYMGRDQVVVGELIHDEMPIPPRLLGILSDYRGRVELAWASLNEGINESAIDESVQPAVEAARAAFMERFGAMRRDVFQAGVTAQDYPVELAVWLAEATAARNAVLELETALTNANQKVATNTSANSSRYFWIMIAVLLGGLGLGVACFWIVWGHVTRPLADITGRYGISGRRKQ